MTVTGTRTQAWRAAVRFIGSVLAVSGTLLIADAAITLKWEEPVSAFLAGRQQAKLKRALESPPVRVRRKHPLKGDAIGELELPSLGQSHYVVEGTDTGSLRKGPGHYHDTPLPGEPGTAAIAGHRTTYGAPFRDIDDLHRGDAVVASMPYGRYTYRVERTRVVSPSALWVKRRVGHDRLILTACHPLYSASQRIVAFAKLVKREAAVVGRG